MPASSGARISAPFAVFASGLWLFALALLVAGLGWQYSRDTPLLNYVGFLIWEHGFAPYRDVFETSMPGTLAVHALIAGLGLTGSVAFMALACVTVVAMAFLGAMAILPLGTTGAIIAAPLLVVAMMIMGPGWVMKIDMVALVPISAALWLAFRQSPGSLRLRQFLIGFLFGIVATMKPHLMLGAPVAVLAAFANIHGQTRLRDVRTGELLAQIAISLAGFAVPLLLIVIWLVATNSFQSFVFVLTEYLPLHLEKTDWQEFLPTAEKQWITFRTTVKLGGNYLMVPVLVLVLVVIGVHRSQLDRRERIILGSLCALLVIYGLAPGLGGQFYIYYYFPFFFFALLLIAASFSLVDRAKWRPLAKLVWVVGIGGFLIFFGSRFYTDTLFWPKRLEIVTQIENALETWVPEGGRVQPIDWTSGVVYAMLRQEILPATPYLYDYHFHHHVGGAVNERIREAFIAALENDPPEAFVEAKDFPRVYGLNTSTSFAERDAFLSERYRLVADEEMFRVFLRNDLVAP